MADSRTSSTLKWRKRWKTLGFALAGVAFGLLLRVAQDIRPVASFSDLILLPAELLPAAKAWLDAHPAFTGWVAGPVVFGLLFFGAAALPWIRNLLDWLAPDPPPFVRSSLEEAKHRDRMISLEGPPLPFVGRDDELATLEGLLAADGAPFIWRVLTGPSGIGKTRLGIEWLEAARSKGWDVGIIDPHDFELAREWKARRPTALLVDEARSDFGDGLGEWLAVLAGAGTARATVRLLVLDQILPSVDIRGGDDRALVRAAVVEAPYRLRKLDDSEILSLCAVSRRTGFDEQRVVRESAGLPRAALILINAPDATDYGDALIEWVERLEPAIVDEARPLPLPIAGPLFLASLAGPIDTDLARELCGDLNAAALAKFFPESEAAGLERRVPTLTPDDLAIALLLRLLPRFDPRRREAMVDRLLVDMPEAVELRLGSAWRSRPDLDRKGGEEGLAAALQWLQERFDRSRADRVERSRGEAAAALRLIEERDPGQTAAALAGLAGLADSRPFDPKMRVLEARGAVIAIEDFGKSGNVAEMERWVARLASVAERFPANSDVREVEAAGAMKAISRYAALGNSDAFESWSSRLFHLCDNEPFRSNLTIRRCEADACVDVTFGNAANPDFAMLERWGARLIALVGEDRFAGDREIRSAEAKAVTNISSAYCTAGRLADHERWAERVTALAADARFAADFQIRFAEGCISANAVAAYGRAGAWESLEACASKLLCLAQDDGLASDPEIARTIATGMVHAIQQYGLARLIRPMERWGDRLAAFAAGRRQAPYLALWESEAMAAINAIAIYGQGQAFEEVERWGARLIAAASEPAFAGRGKMPVLEVMGAFGALTVYAVAGRNDPVERWGARIVALARDSRFANDPEIRGYEAQAAYNAIAGYDGQAERRGVCERWRQRLAHVALKFPFDREIQAVADLVDLTAPSQRRKGFPYGRSPGRQAPD